MVAEALRIDGDDWSFDLIGEIEASFGVEFSNDALGAVSNVGELFDLIMAYSPTEGGAACATSMTFYRLRRALTKLGVANDAKPDLNLTRAGLPSPSVTRKLLFETTGLAMPAPTVGWLACVGLILAILFPVAGFLWGAGWIAFPVVILAVVLVKRDRGTRQGDLETLGSLARATAARNHAALVNMGARHSAATAWTTLTTLLAGWGTPASEIARETRLFA